MTKKIVTFDVPASVTYDDQLSDAASAIEDFFRALEEAEQASFMDRQIIDIGYGGPANVSPPQDVDDDSAADDAELQRIESSACDQ